MREGARLGVARVEEAGGLAADDDATAQVLANGLGLLGVSAPEKM